LGYTGCLSFDRLAKITCKKISVSAVALRSSACQTLAGLPRSEAFRGATTQFDATAAHRSGFKAPFTLSEGLHRTLPVCRRGRHYEFIDTD